MERIFFKRRILFVRGSLRCLKKRREEEGKKAEMERRKNTELPDAGEVGRDKGLQEVRCSGLRLKNSYTMFLEILLCVYSCFCYEVRIKMERIVGVQSSGKHLNFVYFEYGGDHWPPVRCIRVGG